MRVKEARKAEEVREVREVKDDKCTGEVWREKEA